MKGISTKFCFLPPRCSLVTPRQWAKWYTHLTHKASSPRAKPSTSGTTWASDLQHPLLCEWSVVWISTPLTVWVVCSLNLNTPCHVSGLWFNSQHPLLCEWPVVWILTPSTCEWSVVWILTPPTCEWSVVWILTPPTCEWPVVWILTPPVMWVVCGLNLSECGWWNRKVQATDSCVHWRYVWWWLAADSDNTVCDHFHFICVWRVVSLMVCPASHSYCFTCPWAYYWRSSTVLAGGMDDDLSLARAIQMKVVCPVSLQLMFPVMIESVPLLILKGLLGIHPSCTRFLLLVGQTWGPLFGLSAGNVIFLMFWLAKAAGVAVCPEPSVDLSLKCSPKITYIMWSQLCGVKLNRVDKVVWCCCVSGVEYCLQRKQVSERVHIFNVPASVCKKKRGMEGGRG